MNTFSNLPTCPVKTSSFYSLGFTSLLSVKKSTYLCDPSFNFLFNHAIESMKNHLEFPLLNNLRAVNHSLNQLLSSHPPLVNFLLKNLLRKQDSQLSDLLSFLTKYSLSIYEIELKGSRFSLDDRSFKKLVETCPRLIDLKLEQQNQLTDEAIKSLTSLPQLKTLKLINCSQLVYKKIRPLGLEKVLKVFVSKNDSITDEELKELSNSFKELEVLHLDTCINVSNKGLEKLKNLKQLKNLSLKNCEKIDNQCRKYLVILGNIKIDLAGTSVDRVSADILSQIIHFFPSSNKTSR